MSLFLKHDRGFRFPVGKYRGGAGRAPLRLAMFSCSQSTLASLAPFCVGVLAAAALAADFPLWLCKGLSSPQPSGLNLNVSSEERLSPDHRVLSLPLLSPVALPS